MTLRNLLCYCKSKTTYLLRNNEVKTLEVALELWKVWKIREFTEVQNSYYSGFFKLPLSEFGFFGPKKAPKNGNFNRNNSLKYK